MLTLLRFDSTNLANWKVIDNPPDGALWCPQVCGALGFCAPEGHWTDCSLNAS